MSQAKTHQMPLRIPESLHVALKYASRHEGLSLNQYCLYLLTRGVKWPQDILTKKGEELLKFIEEAQILQNEMLRPNRSRK